MEEELFEGFVDSTICGLRLDQALVKLFHFSRTQGERFIDEGKVLVNGKFLKKREKVKEKDIIQVEFFPKEPYSLKPEEMPFDIVYEDEWLIAINKPSGLVVHPAPGNWEHTFVHGLLFHCKDLKCQDPIRPGIVHRLDKDTTGLLLAAKTEEALRFLSEQFMNRTIEKEYEALVVGSFSGTQEIVEPIGRDSKDRKKMAVSPTGRAAKTVITSKRQGKDVSHVSIRIYTGRTHQIRVHAAHIGFPILGDPLYGKPSKYTPPRIMLHASRLQFFHPMSRKKLVLQAELSDDMKAMIQSVGLS